MEDILGAMWLASPLGLAMMACVAIGFAVTAREALGRERGLRAAGEQRHEDEESALADAKEDAERELRRHRRLLDCHVDALIAAITSPRARPVPLPGCVLETFCATIPGWQRKLAESTGLVPRDLERLLKSDLPITPVLARQLEAFTGTPARYWEFLWCLQDDYRTDAEETQLIQLSEPATKRENSARAPAAPAPTSARPGPAAVPERAPDVPPPVVAIPDLVARSPRAKLPSPPQPRARSPLPSRASSRAEPERRAARLTSFPVQRDEGGSSTAQGANWENSEGSSLNTTLPGVGSVYAEGTQAD
ncbi:helix-turn-helix transcriptional regulator [Sorangium sp. So ce854]|uniref:helix-turn-helix transcriptional regulator n=1 Tax=Sorangium sp. So ce854 TaxID=3133322 RepID=UPI003F646619